MLGGEKNEPGGSLGSRLWVEQDGEGVPKPWKEDPWGLILGQSYWVHFPGCFLHFKCILVLLPLKL